MIHYNILEETLEKWSKFIGRSWELTVHVLTFSVLRKSKEKERKVLSKNLLPKFLKFLNAFQGMFQLSSFSSFFPGTFSGKILNVHMEKLLTFLTMVESNAMMTSL